MKRARRQASFEVVGGLNDADVTVGLGPTSGRHPSYGGMVEVHASENVDKDEPSTSPFNKWRTRTVVSGDKSLAVQSLPDFIEPHWKTMFVPTMVQLIGQDEHPWSFASDKAGAKDNKHLMDLVQTLVNAFWPQRILRSHWRR